jgi:ribosomal protein S18 acetylase RimI-like enzyme
VDDSGLLERNLRGMAALHRLVGRHAGTVVELDGAVASLVPALPDYVWLNALVCEPGASLGRVLEAVVQRAELDKVAVWACGSDQAEIAVEAGFTDLVARLPAMSMELEHAEGAGSGEPIGLAEAGALNDAAYGNQARELERTLGQIPAWEVRPCGRRDSAGRLVAVALLLDVEDDCSVQYVATRPDAQRRGHGLALLSDALASAHLRGASTTSLQASDAGVPLYRKLGYRTVGQLELRRRPRPLA